MPAAEGYLIRLRDDMERDPVSVVRDSDGSRLFGFRCWPNYQDQSILDAVLDGLRHHAGETDGVLIERGEELIERGEELIERYENPGDALELAPWAEAWRASDRTLVVARPLPEVLDALRHRHHALTRG
jgi:hypothetical protein